MTATLVKLVEMVRAEAGHSLAVSQGLNSEETIKQLIRRAEEELWTAFDWPELTIRVDLPVLPGEVEYKYPHELHYDQIRHVYWISSNADICRLVDFRIPEASILPVGVTHSDQHSGSIQLWDTYFNSAAKEPRIRVWPIPNVNGYLRLIGLRKIPPMIDDTDFCTLDENLIVMRVASRLLTRAKAADADMVNQSFQRHLSKVQARMNSDKQKVSVLGSPRAGQHLYGRHGIEFIR